MAATAIPVVSVQATAWGAVGDGVHDDTTALQNALNYALSSGSVGVFSPYQRLNLVLPPGVYKITAPLTINRPGALYAGITIQGAGTSPQGAPLEGGTTIFQAGTAQDSVIKINQGQIVDICIRDMTLAMSSDTAVGLHIATTQASRYHFENLIITAPAGCHGEGFRQDYGNGNANGESPVFINVNVFNVDTLFDFRSGQAFGCVMISCGGVKNNGGTSIKAGIGDNGGYQMTIIGWSGSSGGGSLPNTFLQFGTTSGNVIVIGARDEEDDTALALGGGSSGIKGVVAITDSHFDGMTTHAGLVTGGGNSAQWHVTLDRDIFSAATTGLAAAVQTTSGHTGAAGDYSHFLWRGCIFEQWASVNLGVKPATGAYDGSVLDDCWHYTYASPLMAAVSN